MEDHDKCEKCKRTFDDKVRPRCLPCGHSFCSRCLKKTMKFETVSCLHCRSLHQAFSIDDIPINHGMEALLTRLRQTQSVNTLKRKFQNSFDEQKEDLEKLVRNCEEKHTLLSTYEEFLLARKLKHDELITKIADVVRQNLVAIENLKKELKTVRDFKKEGDKHKSVAVSKLAEYSCETHKIDPDDAIDDMEKSRVNLEVWKRSCTEQVPSTETVISSEKIISGTTAALEIIRLVNQSTQESVQDSSFPLLNMFSTITNINMMSLTDLARNVLDPSLTGKLYAVQTCFGYIRSAKITVQNGKTFLHCLQNGAPPKNALCIQHYELIGTLNNESVVTFMDLAWEGHSLGRILIHLTPDTPLARHFRFLCSGDFGYSYVQCKFLEVCRKGHERNERVKVGDYERNDGRGGALILEGLNVKEGDYNRVSGPGVVWASYTLNDPSRIAQFSITTGKGNGCCWSQIFGQVIDGLEIVKAAIDIVEDIRNVSIADCGVMLPR